MLIFKENNEISIFQKEIQRRWQTTNLEGSKQIQRKYERFENKIGISFNP